jgi:coenzyme F420-0:L-glutamate ligase/coenzyme F420-1:gamma-L-glutamate ligase
MGEPDLALHRLGGIPLVEPGDNLPTLLQTAIREQGLHLQPGDLLIIAQKIVSKAEGRIVNLKDIKPSEQAQSLAKETDKDPRLVELILRESSRVLRTRPGLIIVEHRLGLILANAGIDRSNVGGDEDTVLLLPEDPDRSATQLRTELAAVTGVAPGVLIIDSIGRPWRLGTTGVAIGAVGVPVLTDLRGEQDMFARELQVAEIAPADSLAAAAALLMGEGAEAIPAVLVRGLPPSDSRQPAATVLRPGHEDLFK